VDCDRGEARPRCRTGRLLRCTEVRGAGCVLWALQPRRCGYRPRNQRTAVELKRLRAGSSSRAMATSAPGLAFPYQEICPRCAPIDAAEFVRWAHWGKTGSRRSPK